MTFSLPDESVFVVRGYGVKIVVRSGHLVIYDRIDGTKRETKIPRITDIRRVIVLAEDGIVTLESLRWLDDANISFMQIDRDGRVISESGCKYDTDPKLRVKQVLITDDIRAQITRYLLSAKLENQASVITDLFPASNAGLRIKGLAGELDDFDSYREITGREGYGSKLYFKAWQENIAVPFFVTDLDFTPEHWRRYPGRQSQARIYESNRNATDPVNAMINYLYTIAETEAVNACHTVGLDPDIGISHVANTQRHGMALDLIEPIRPYCDRIALAYVDTGLGLPNLGPGRGIAWFKKEWCYETRNGVCRLYPPLTSDLAAHAGDIFDAILPYTRAVAKLLTAGSKVSAHSSLPARTRNKRKT